MALTWDIGEVKHYKRLFTKKDEEGRTQLKQPYDMMIWLTMTIGISKITKKNYKKFFNRVRLVEQTKGAFLIQRIDGGKAKPRPIQLKDVERMIGLHTNASDLSRTKFLSIQLDKEDL